MIRPRKDDCPRSTDQDSGVNWPLHRVACNTDDAAVMRAVADLVRDIGWVTGRPGQVCKGLDSDAGVVVEIQSHLGGPECYRLTTNAGRVQIVGSDTLGLIYGIYAFSRDVLGVDPYWFWKDLPPARRERVAMPEGCVEGGPGVFRYRGWFLNDEDLLSKWRGGGGRRDLDYRYYERVMRADVLDAVCETLLRAGGNMIIPGSFVDVMNPDEATLVKVAVERGLYVTQHHIEPLGVSHFSYETYWQRQGIETTLRYRDEPERARTTWRTYAQRWSELAGDRVIWQLGLRGRGDRAIWASDKAISPDLAGQYISRAISDQWAIVRDVDSRDVPPATATIYDECSGLMARGQLTIPDPVAVIFCDKGPRLRMQADFHTHQREHARAYGAYTHIAFWSRGPHLVAGQSPRRASEVVADIARRGDTHYLILNTSNVREHIFGIDAAMQTAWDLRPFDHDAFWADHLPHQARDLGPRFFDSIAQAVEQTPFTDGDARRLLNAPPERAAQITQPGTEAKNIEQWTKTISDETLLDAAAALEQLASDAAAKSCSTREQPYIQAYFVGAPAVLASLYRMVVAYRANRVDEAVGWIDQMLCHRMRMAAGRFDGWYDGDDKANWAQVRATLTSTAPKD